MKYPPTWVKARLDALKHDGIYTRCKAWLESLPDGSQLAQELDCSSGLGYDTPALQNDLVAIRQQIGSLKLARSAKSGSHVLVDITNGHERARFNTSLHLAELREEAILQGWRRMV